MKNVCIATIVEGHGEVKAFPELIRRIANDIDPGFYPVITHPHRVPGLMPPRNSERINSKNLERNTLARHTELARAVELAARKIAGRGGIIILCDCEDHCPAEEGPVLLEWAKKARSDTPVSVILATREYETWFMASAESIANQHGLAPGLAPPENVEAIRGAKEWLSRRMPRNQPYHEMTHQEELTKLFDMQAARHRSKSFDRCYRKIHDMLRLLRGEAS